MPPEKINKITESNINNVNNEKKILSMNSLKSRKSIRALFNKKLIVSKKLNSFHNSIFILLFFLLFLVNFTQSAKINNIRNI